MTTAARSNGSEPPAGCSPATRDADCFHTCIAHFYRGEMHRMTVWRQRLDTTTHWAIILTTGLTTFTLGAEAVPHYIVLLGLAINSIFLLIEGRRYRHLHHTKWRLSLIEHNYFAAQLARVEPMEPTWREQLTWDLQKPHFTIGLSMGVRLRLRRNYLMLTYFMTALWLTKVFIHPDGKATLVEFYERLAVGQLFPSWFVAATAAVFVLGVTVAAVLTPSEEALERWSKLEHARFLEKLAQADGVPRLSEHP